MITVEQMKQASYKESNVSIAVDHADSESNSWSKVSAGQTQSEPTYKIVKNMIGVVLY